MEVKKVRKIKVKKIAEKIIKGGSKRGLTWSDTKLQKIGLSVGSHFTTIVDLEKNKTIIRVSEEGNTVSRKKSGCCCTSSTVKKYTSPAGM